ncbi:hypothetical protein [Thalassotalea sp. Y01]|uniref:hypothetical protein n=1 Tax=Thalassotalea sp. Y01 TaxID=2729613 RepID=UPI00145EC504|nr:hypothetical protein [Thalassotalea sp. Y01]NMP15818.1 hypothetical protein [Thalassotalea sp. Y01]
MKTITISLLSTLMLSQAGCAFISEDPCEDIVFTSEQREQCAQLQRQIVNAKNNPIKRTELERRYEQDCVNIRYYRDDKTDERCNNQTSVDSILREGRPEDVETATGASD